MNTAAFGIHLLFLDTHVEGPAVSVHGQSVVGELSRYHQSDDVPERCGLSRWFTPQSSLTANRTVVVDHEYRLPTSGINQSPESRYVPFSILIATNPAAGSGAVHTGASVLIKDGVFFYDLYT
jgi:hypothetical protein